MWMSDARERLKAKIQEAIRMPVSNMLADPGPYVWKDGADASEELADAVLAALCDGDRTNMGGWMLKSYGQHQVLEVIEFDMQDTSGEFWSWNVYTKTPQEYED